MGRERATVMVCDNPQCATARVTEKPEPAMGFYFGRGQFHLDWGGSFIPPIYACSRECVEAAVAHVLKETMD